MAHFERVAAEGKGLDFFMKKQQFLQCTQGVLGVFLRKIHNSQDGESCERQGVCSFAKTHRELLMKKGVFWISVLFLIFQNLAIFWDHYFGRAFFSFDFLMTYYGMVAYWTTVIREGHFPQWMPFQNMGFPFVASVQSAFFYPPFWIFTLSGLLPYSIQSAVVMESLHILFGAIGFFLFLRLFVRTPSLALLGAVAFQFFGGFYSNAEHPDIVRAYAWLPWLFYVTQVQWPANLAVNRTGTVLSLRNYFIPIVLLCFVTGSYPGNLFSHLAFLGGIRFLELLFCCKGARLKWPEVRPYFYVLFLCGLGIALASIYLVPVTWLREFLSRSTDFNQFQKTNWTIKNWPTLFMVWTNDGYGDDSSMVSCFVTVPMVCLWGLARIQVVKRNGIWMLGFILAVAMAGGLASPVYRGITQLVPLLSISRFPTSDYRGLVALFFILFSILFLDQFEGSTLKDRTSDVSICSVFLRLGAIPFFIVLGYGVGLFSVPHLAREFFCTALVALFSIGVVVLFLAHSSKWILGLLGLVVVSGFYVISLSDFGWKHWGDVNQWYWEGLRLDTRKTLPIATVLKSPPQTRPKRLVSKDFVDFSWRGYLTGEFIHTGYDTSIIQQRKALVGSPLLSQYMEKPWTPLLMRNLSELNCATLEVSSSNNKVEQMSYGMNEIQYRVNATEDFTFVENEVYFPGWKGIAQAAEIQAESACGGLRAWHLPKGQYVFKSEFVMPGLVLGAKISFFAFIIYMGIFGKFLLRHKASF